MTQSPSAEDSPLPVARARRLRAQGIQRRATGDDAARTGGGHGPEQEFGAALHAYALDLGLPAQDPASKKFSLGPWSLELGMKYVQTSPLVLGGNPFLHSLNRNCQETCSLAEPDGLTWCTARFATHKEMFVNMPVGMRLPLYCTAAGARCCRGWIRTWPTGCWSAATVDPIPPPRSPAWTPCWLSWSSRAGTAMHVPMASSTRATSPSAPPCWMPAASPGRGQCVGSIQPLVVRTGAGRVWSAGGRNRACHQRVAHLGTFLSLLRAGASGGALRATPISVAGEA